MAIYKPDDVGAWIGNWIVENAKTDVVIDNFRQELLMVNVMRLAGKMPTQQGLNVLMGEIQGIADTFMLPIYEAHKLETLKAVLQSVSHGIIDLPQMPDSPYYLKAGE